MKTITFNQTSFTEELNTTLGFQYVNQKGTCAGLCDIYMYYVMVHEAKGEDNKYKDFIDYLNSKVNKSKEYKIKNNKNTAKIVDRSENVAKIINYFQDYANSGHDNYLDNIHKIKLNNEDIFYNNIKDILKPGKFFHISLKGHAIIIAQDASGKYRYFDPNEGLSYNMTWEDLEKKLKWAVKGHGLNENTLYLEDAKYRIEKYLGSENQKQAKKDIRNLTSILAKNTKTKKDTDFLASIAFRPFIINKNLWQKLYFQENIDCSHLNPYLVKEKLKRETEYLMTKSYIEKVFNKANTDKMPKKLDLSEMKGLFLKKALDNISQAKIELILFNSMLNETDIELIEDFLKKTENVNVIIGSYINMDKQKALDFFSKLGKEITNPSNALIRKPLTFDALFANLNNVSNLDLRGFYGTWLQTILKSIPSENKIKYIIVQTTAIDAITISYLQAFLEQNNKILFLDSAKPVDKEKVKLVLKLIATENLYGHNEKDISTYIQFKIKIQENKLDSLDLRTFAHFWHKRLLQNIPKKSSIQTITIDPASTNINCIDNLINILQNNNKIFLEINKTIKVNEEKAIFLLKEMTQNKPYRFIIDMELFSLKLKKEIKGNKIETLDLTLFSEDTWYKEILEMLEDEIYSVKKIKINQNIIDKEVTLFLINILEYNQEVSIDIDNFTLSHEKALYIFKGMEEEDDYDVTEGITSLKLKQEIKENKIETLDLTSFSESIWLDSVLDAALYNKNIKKIIINSDHIEHHIDILKKTLKNNKQIIFCIDDINLNQSDALYVLKQMDQEYTLKEALDLLEKKADPTPEVKNSAAKSVNNNNIWSPAKFIYT